MGGKGSGRRDTGAARLLRTHIKKEFYLRRPKLTEEEAEEIRKLRAEGLTQKAIASRLSVSQSTVCVYLMSEEKKQEYLENRRGAHRHWVSAHGSQYFKVMKRKRHLKEIGGLVEKDDWKTGVIIYDK